MLEATSHSVNTPADIAWVLVGVLGFICFCLWWGLIHKENENARLRSALHRLSSRMESAIDRYESPQLFDVETDPHRSECQKIGGTCVRRDHFHGYSTAKRKV